jgi:c-di-GMP phosphodiesterase
LIKSSTALHTSQIARNKLEAIMKVSKVAGVQLIGECIETAEALAHLRAEGVGYGQGFGIRPPAPIDDVAGG